MNLSAAPTWLVTSARVPELHAAALAEWGGAGGKTDTGCVESSIGNALSAAYYLIEDDDEPDVLTVSVHILVYLARNHCFADGNKRVAWMAFTEQLAILGLHVDATNSEVVDFVVRISTGELGAPGGHRMGGRAPRGTPERSERVACDLAGMRTIPGRPGPGGMSGKLFGVGESLGWLWAGHRRVALTR